MPVRKRSADLFPTDRPIPADQMIGRTTDVREVATALDGGTSLVIAGPRRTGKTSACEAALKQLVSRGLYTASVDLFRIATAAEFAEALVAETISNRSVLKRAMHKAKQAGRFVADAVETSAVVKVKSELGEEVEIAFRPDLASRDPERFLDYALDLPGRIAKADGKQIVVFFDEFQELASSTKPYGDPDRLTKKMRAIFQRAEDSTYLFAGSAEHLMRDLFVPTHRALHQFGQFHDLRPIPEDAWVSGLKGRFATDDCEVDPGALVRLIAYGEMHPRSTMLIAQQSHLTSIELDTRDIDLAVVEQGLLAALRGDRVSHEQAIERIRHVHRLGLVVVERLARDEAVYPGLPRGSVRRALEALQNAAIIESHGRGDWRISNPLFRRYLISL